MNKITLQPEFRPIIYNFSFLVGCLHHKIINQNAICKFMSIYIYIYIYIYIIYNIYIYIYIYNEVAKTLFKVGIKDTEAIIVFDGNFEHCLLNLFC